MKNPRRYSLVRQLVWAATLATGFGVIWLMLAAWLGYTIQESLRGGGRRWPEQEQLVIKLDGTPLIERYRWDDAGRAKTTYRDLKGVAQKEMERTDLIDAVSMSGEPPRPNRSLWRAELAREARVFRQRSRAERRLVLCAQRQARGRRLFRRFRPREPSADGFHRAFGSELRSCAGGRADTRPSSKSWRRVGVELGAAMGQMEPER